MGVTVSFYNFSRVQADPSQLQVFAATSDIALATGISEYAKAKDLPSAKHMPLPDLVLPSIMGFGDDNDFLRGATVTYLGDLTCTGEGVWAVSAPWENLWYSSPQCKETRSGAGAVHLFTPVAMEHDFTADALSPLERELARVVSNFVGENVPTPGAAGSVGTAIRRWAYLGRIDGVPDATTTWATVAGYFGQAVAGLDHWSCPATCAAPIIDPGVYAADTAHNGTALPGGVVLSRQPCRGNSADGSHSTPDGYRLLIGSPGARIRTYSSRSSNTATGVLLLMDINATYLAARAAQVHAMIEQGAWRQATEWPADNVPRAAATAVTGDSQDSPGGFSTDQDSLFGSSLAYLGRHRSRSQNFVVSVGHADVNYGGPRRGRLWELELQSDGKVRNYNRYSGNNIDNNVDSYDRITAKMTIGSDMYNRGPPTVVVGSVNAGFSKLRTGAQVIVGLRDDTPLKISNSDTIEPRVLNLPPDIRQDVVGIARAFIQLGAPNSAPLDQPLMNTNDVGAALPAQSMYNMITSTDTGLLMLSEIRISPAGPETMAPLSRINAPCSVAMTPLVMRSDVDHQYTRCVSAEGLQAYWESDVEPGLYGAALGDFNLTQRRWAPGALQLSLAQHLKVPAICSDISAAVGTAARLRAGTELPSTYSDGTSLTATGWSSSNWNNAAAMSNVVNVSTAQGLPGCQVHFLSMADAGFQELIAAQQGVCSAWPSWDVRNVTVPGVWPSVDVLAAAAPDSALAYVGLQFANATRAALASTSGATSVESVDHVPSQWPWMTLPALPASTAATLGISVSSQCTLVFSRAGSLSFSSVEYVNELAANISSGPSVRNESAGVFLLCDCANPGAARSVLAQLAPSLGDTMVASAKTWASALNAALTPPAPPPRLPFEGNASELAVEHMRAQMPHGVLLASPVRAFDARAYLSGFGRGFTSLGDLDGDGMPEVIIGLPGSTDLSFRATGSAVVVSFDPRRNMALFPGITITGSDVLPGMGQALGFSAVPLDMDGDGQLEVLISAPSTTPGSNLGSCGAIVVVYFTPGQYQVPPLDLATELPAGVKFDNGGGIGERWAVLRTVAIHAEAPNADAGLQYYAFGNVYAGSGSGFARQIEAAGDLNGDGIPDLLVTSFQSFVQLTSWKQSGAVLAMLLEPSNADFPIKALVQMDYASYSLGTGARPSGALTGDADSAQYGFGVAVLQYAAARAPANCAQQFGFASALCDARARSNAHSTRNDTTYVVAACPLCRQYWRANDKYGALHVWQLRNVPASEQGQCHATSMNDGGSMRGYTGTYTHANGTVEPTMLCAVGHSTLGVDLNFPAGTAINPWEVTRAAVTVGDLDGDGVADIMVGNMYTAGDTMQGSKYNLGNFVVLYMNPDLRSVRNIRAMYPGESEWGDAVFSGTIPWVQQAYIGDQPTLARGFYADGSPALMTKARATILAFAGTGSRTESPMIVPLAAHCAVLHSNTVPGLFMGTAWAAAHASVLQPAVANFTAATTAEEVVDAWHAMLRVPSPYLDPDYYFDLYGTHSAGLANRSVASPWAWQGPKESFHTIRVPVMGWDLAALDTPATAAALNVSDLADVTGPASLRAPHIRMRWLNRASDLALECLNVTAHSQNLSADVLRARDEAGTSTGLPAKLHAGVLSCVMPPGFGDGWELQVGVDLAPFQCSHTARFSYDTCSVLGVNLTTLPKLGGVGFSVTGVSFGQPGGEASVMPQAWLLGIPPVSKPRVFIGTQECSVVQHLSGSEVQCGHSPPGYGEQLSVSVRVGVQEVCTLPLAVNYSLPTVTRLSGGPFTVAGGDALWLWGRDFAGSDAAASVSSAQVLLGAMPCASTQVMNDSAILCITPAMTGKDVHPSGWIRYADGSQQRLDLSLGGGSGGGQGAPGPAPPIGRGFTINFLPPNLEAVVPRSAPAGDRIILIGTDLGHAASAVLDVTVGGRSCSRVGWIAHRVVECITPPLPAAATDDTVNLLVEIVTSAGNSSQWLPVWTREALVLSRNPAGARMLAGRGGALLAVQASGQVEESAATAMDYVFSVLASATRIEDDAARWDAYAKAGALLAALPAEPGLRRGLQRGARALQSTVPTGLDIDAFVETLPVFTYTVPLAQSVPSRAPASISGARVPGINDQLVLSWSFTFLRNELEVRGFRLVSSADGDALAAAVASGDAAELAKFATLVYSLDQLSVSPARAPGALGTFRYSILIRGVQLEPLWYTVAAENSVGTGPMGVVSQPIMEQCLGNGAADAVDQYLQTELPLQERVCKLCPPGATCGAGGTDFVMAAPGYFRVPWGKFGLQFEECTYPPACGGIASAHELALIRARYVNDTDVAASSADGVGHYPAQVLAVSADAQQHCALGHKGLLCQACEIGYAPTSVGDCKRCASLGAAVGALIGGLLLFTLVLAYMVRSAYTAFDRADHGPAAVKKIIISHLQQVAVLLSYDLQWPGAVQGLLDTFNISASVSDSLLSVDCLLVEGQRPFVIKTVVTMVSPFLMVTAAAMFFVVFAYGCRVKRCGYGSILPDRAAESDKDRPDKMLAWGSPVMLAAEKERKQAATAASGGAAAPAAARRAANELSGDGGDDDGDGAVPQMHNPMVGKRKIISHNSNELASGLARAAESTEEVAREQNRLDSYTDEELWISRSLQFFAVTVVVVLYLLQASLTRAALRVFACKSIGQHGARSRRLVGDIDVDCDDPNNASIMFGAGLPLAALFGVGIPLLALVVLALRRKLLYTDRPTQRVLGLLYAGLRREKWFWESIVLARKSLLAAGAVLLQPLSLSMQVQFTMLFTLIALVVHSINRPYESEVVNMIETTSLLTVLLTMLAGLFFTSPVPDHNGRVVVSALVLVVNIGFLVMASLYIAHKYSQVARQLVLEAAHRRAALKQRQKLLDRSALYAKRVAADAKRRRAAVGQASAVASAKPKPDAAPQHKPIFDNPMFRMSHM